MTKTEARPARHPATGRNRPEDVSSVPLRHHSMTGRSLRGDPPEAYVKHWGTPHPVVLRVWATKAATWPISKRPREGLGTRNITPKQAGDHSWEKQRWGWLGLAGDGRQVDEGNRAEAAGERTLGTQLSATMAMRTLVKGLGGEKQKQKMLRGLLLVIGLHSC